ncbi:hypothetical protein [Leptothoe sp. PORK10 BA2]|uniref:hypothetical protein n=1 Tax=Leptothoe sp. PORK10 BA2 TaxID=3110254 RepID=UPI002B1F7D75|nr:hypothetical protein [Leptothoe sp. PORK10 BA2]MEA5465397.1 hypothetical protein [Leptothoe sp. PORK10 BA2]
MEPSLTMEPLLTRLHKMLRQMEEPAEDGANNALGETVASIQARIRAMVPEVDTGRSLPHKKTPSGRTTVLHLNYTRGQSEQPVETELEHLRFLARTAKELGLRLEILTDTIGRNDVEQQLAKDDYKTLDYAITALQNPVSKWAEDSVEYLENGRVAVLNPFDQELLIWAMTEGRKQRWQGKVPPEDLAEVLQEDQLWILLGVRVNALRMGLEREQAARAKAQPVGHIRAYIEGGNMMVGEDITGQPMVLVGKDAIAATANIYQLSDNDVRRLICEDFGLDTIAQVVCVEQPGQFHLDMGMLFVGHGVVILNDSSEALQNAIEIAEMVPCQTTERMAAKLQLQCNLENDAAQDLTAAGLKVRREKLENEVFYNFFNGEFVTGKNGLNYYITNGGIKAQEERFAALMTTGWQIVENVFFSPEQAAHKSLQERGGVGCRIKGAHW